MTPEPIIFRQDRRKDGSYAVYVAQEWPECALIHPGVLRNNPSVSIDDDGLIVIKCENGYAAYKLAKEQLGDYDITVELSDGSFSEPSPVEPQKQSNQ